MPATIRRQETSRELVLDPVARLKKLGEHGSSVEIDRSIPVRRYLRSGAEMERQARVYYTEGQWDRAFMLYNKFATLFIEKLPKHPEYSKASAAEKSKIKKLLKEAALPRAMDLKEKLKERYEKEREEMEKTIQQENEAQAEKAKMEAQAKKEKEEQLQKKAQDQAEEVAKFLSGEGGVVTSAVPSTHHTIKNSMQEVSSGNVAMETEPIVIEDDKEESKASPEVVQYPAQMESREQGIVTHSGSRDSPVEIDRAEMAPTKDDLTTTDPRLAQVLPPGPVPTAGPVPVTTPYQVQSPAPMQPSLTSQQTLPSAPPPPNNLALFQAPPPPTYSPYQSPPPSTFSTYQTPPPNFSAYQTPPIFNPAVASPATPPVVMSPALQQPTYEKSVFQSPFLSSSSDSQVSTSSTPPVVDRSTKPDSLKALSTDCWTAGVDGYRPLFIPMDTASKFEEIASPNTRKNVETCGILAGKLSQNTLRITHIIVPKQRGKADSCEMVNEEDLFDVQDQYDLITLGWIHTHPTQTAFMSSVDLHNHCSYQVMMDEAVAIVVAPKYKQVGYFMLTEPHGLNYITHCEEEGFHTHPKEPPLYEECTHIHHDQKTFIQIVDLR